MKKFNFKDFKYTLIDSAKKGYKEVLVTYNADGTTARQYLFVKESKGKGNDYYISAAKKIIDERVKSGELIKVTAKQLKFKGVKTGGALKPVLITLAILVGLGGAGAGGYYITQYLGGGTGGGGVIPKPGDEVLTDVTVSNLPEGVSVTAGKKAVIGQDYDTTIYLNEVSSINANGFTLPTSLDKVSYKIGDKETEIAKENYTYTLDTTSDGDQANLHIAKEYVLGQIDVQLTLTPKQVTELTVTYGENVVVKDVKSKDIILSGTKVPVKNKNLSLICEPGEGYELDHDSFSFGGATGVTWEYVPSTGEGEDSILTINGLASSCELNITSHIPQPKLISFTAHKDSSSSKFAHIYYEDDVEEIEDASVVKILSDATSCKFKVTTDDGYIVDDFMLAYTNNPKDNPTIVPDDAYKYTGEFLTISNSVSDPDFKITNVSDLYIRVLVAEEQSFVYASIVTDGCTITYNGVEYDKPATIKVYPYDDDFKVNLKIKAKQGYAFADECVKPVTPGLLVNDIIQEDEYFTVVFSGAKDNFYVDIPLYKLPTTCICLDYESMQYGGFYEPALGTHVCYDNIEHHIGDDYFGEVFSANDEFKDTPFALFVSNTGDLKITRQEYSYIYDTKEVYCWFDGKIKEGQQFVIHLEKPVDNPTLRLDDDSKNLIELTDSSGKSLGSETILLTEYKGKNTADFFFRGKDTSSDYEYALSFGSFDYSCITNELTSQEFGKFYHASIIFKDDETYEWPGYNLELHTNRYDTYQVSIKSFVEESCSIYDEYRDPKHMYPLNVGNYNLVSVDGDITIAVRIDPKQFMLHEENVIIKGETFTSYEVVVDEDEWDFVNIIVHGVTGGFEIESITPVSPGVTITSSLAEDYTASGFTITTSDGDQLFTSEKDYIYNASTDRLVFKVSGPDPDTIAVDGLAYIDYVTKDDKTGRIYGSFDYNFKLGTNDFDRGRLTFNSSDLHKYKSMVLHITTYEPDTTFVKYPGFEYQKGKGSPVRLVNVDGNSGTYFSATLYHKLVNIYISTEEELLPEDVSLKRNYEEISFELQQVEYGEFNYMITVTANSGDLLLLSC